MSASGSTPHLHLSQYLDTDHPSYVSDYTGDMSRIDTGFNLAQTNALTALNRVAALEQSIGSAGVVGQTTTFSSDATVSDPEAGSHVTLGFAQPTSVITRNAEDLTDVPWTWDYTGGMATPVFTGHGVYRITVEACASFSPSLEVSSAFMYVVTGGTHIVPFAYANTSSTRNYYANGSFVVPYTGRSYDDGIVFLASLNHTTVSDAPIRCDLTIDIEQLSPQYSQQQ